MTRIIGTIKDAIAPLDGELTISLDETLIDTNTDPNTIHTKEPYRVSVTGGEIDIQLTPSRNTTYRFRFALITVTQRFYSPDGNVYTGLWHEHEGEYYTGATHDEDSEFLNRADLRQERVIQDFHAKVPDRDTVEYSDLIATGISKDLLDSSIARIVDLLSTNINFINAVNLQFAQAINIEFSPYENITATNVQGAIQQSEERSLSADQNLGDLQSASSARDNLALGSAALADSSDFASEDHQHQFEDIIFTEIPKGGGNCVITNAPSGTYGPPDKWLKIQSINSRQFVVPAWKLNL